MIKKPVSIEDIGLEQYLKDTVVDHNGYVYEDFVKNLKLGKTGLALMFGVNRKTIYRWLEVYDKERNG